MQQAEHSKETGDPIPVQFDPLGPEGFADLRVPLPYARLINGSPAGADHVYFQRKSVRLTAGLWRADPYEEFYDAYPCDEFMVMLKGEVTVGNDQQEWTFRSGDAFLIPKGFRGFWRQTTSVEKYYVIVGNPVGNGPCCDD